MLEYASVILLLVITTASAMPSPRIAIVTGANKGIGFHIAERLIREGFYTIIACRNEALGLEAVGKLGVIGKDVELRQLDISDSKSIDSFSAAIQKDFSGGIDVLVNNAAIAFKNSDPTPFAQQAAPTFQTNFFGTVHLTTKMIPLLEKRGDGRSRIVNVASQAGMLRIIKDGPLKVKMASAEQSMSLLELEDVARDFVTTVSSGATGAYPHTCYGFSKLCVIAYTKILARLHPCILSNACCPGRHLDCADANHS